MIAPEEWWGKWSEVISNTVEAEPEEPMTFKDRDEVPSESGSQVFHPIHSNVVDPLIDCIDADIWAKQFVERNKLADVDYMRSWFASAIMNGYDTGYRRAKDTHDEPNHEPDPTPTEMVKRLLEKGWIIDQEEDDDGTVTIFKGPGGVYGTTVIAEAYRKAFPTKKRIEVEVWTSKLNPGQEVWVLNTNSPTKYICKGTAVFWVEESHE